MKSFHDWLVPGYEQRMKDVAKPLVKHKIPLYSALNYGMTYEVAAKCNAEFASHLELIEDLQDRLAQYEGRQPAKSIVHRSFVPITLKAAHNNGVRSLTGTASTGSLDRMGDIVEPMGAKIKLPVPLLLQHDHSQPVGLVESATPTAKGIPFKATISEVKEPGKLKDRTDEAWQLVEHGLIRGVSIGFRASESEAIKGGGLRFIAWELLELSLVTIPANPEATIDSPLTKNLADHYAGIWRWGDSHTRGTLITDHGSLWLCLDDTEKRPGTNGAWRLVSKRGKQPGGRA